MRENSGGAPRLWRQLLGPGLGALLFCGGQLRALCALVACPRCIRNLTACRNVSHSDDCFCRRGGMLLTNDVASPYPPAVAQRGRTPLHWAAYLGRFKCAKALLQSGPASMVNIPSARVRTHPPASPCPGGPRRDASKATDGSRGTHRSAYCLLLTSGCSRTAPPHAQPGAFFPLELAVDNDELRACKLGTEALLRSHGAVLSEPSVRAAAVPPAVLAAASFLASLNYDALNREAVRNAEFCVAAAVGAAVSAARSASSAWACHSRAADDLDAHFAVRLLTEKMPRRGGGSIAINAAALRFSRRGGESGGEGPFVFGAAAAPHASTSAAPTARNPLQQLEGLHLTASLFPPAVFELALARTLRKYAIRAEADAAFRSVPALEDLRRTASVGDGGNGGARHQVESGGKPGRALFAAAALVRRWGELQQIAQLAVSAITSAEALLLAARARAEAAREAAQAEVREAGQRPGGSAAAATVNGYELAAMIAPTIAPTTDDLEEDDDELFEWWLQTR